MDDAPVMKPAERTGELLPEAKRPRDRQRLGQDRLEQIAEEVLDDHRRLGSVADQRERPRYPGYVQGCEELVLRSKPLSARGIGFFIQPFEQYEPIVPRAPNSV